MDKTKINYETYLDCWYDLVNNPTQRSAMLGKVARMVSKFGSLECFREKLVEEMEGMKFLLNQRILKWFTLQQQIEFIDKIKSGEINDLEESEGFYHVPGPEAGR